MTDIPYWQKRRDQKNGQAPSGGDLPKKDESPAKGTKPGKSPKKPFPKRIKAATKKRAKQNRAYTPLKKKFLIANPTCQANLDGCTIKSTDLHHIGGRKGKDLLKVEDFAALCRNCHDLIHNKLSAEKAKLIGMKK